MNKTFAILGLGKFGMTKTDGFPFDKVSQEGGRYYLFPVTLESNVKELHKYLYDNEDYQPSKTVEKISQTISEVSGYYGD